MQGFIEQHHDQIVGDLSGFDRILFRGTIRALSYRDGMDDDLNVHGELYENFGDFVRRISDQVKDDAVQNTASHDRPFRYLASASPSK